MVINVTCGGGAFFLPDPLDEGTALPESDIASVEDRVRHIRDCLPEICTLDVTTANQVDGGVDHVYLNTTRTLRAMATIFKNIGVKPELETFQAGDVMFANQMVAEGLIDGIPLYQFVLGVKWGAPSTLETVTYMRNLLPPECFVGSDGNLTRSNADCRGFDTCGRQCSRRPGRQSLSR